MRSGGDRRGNTRNRAARKLWLLGTFGDGVTCDCAHCGRELTYDTVEADRIVPGGSYRRENLQPACRHCNASRGARTDWQGPLVAALAEGGIAA